MPTVRAHLFVRGRVQGVGFRWSAELTARACNVAGWVRNRGDGRVEAVFEGEPAQVERAVEWCRHGPPGARVEDVEVAWEAPAGEDGFRIAPTA